MNKIRKNMSAYLYLVPAAILIIALIVYPVIDLVMGSLMTRRDGEMVFAGTWNFQMVLADDNFITAIGNNLKLFLCVPVMTLLALIIAVLLHQKIRFWKFYRNLTFVPYVLAVTVVGIVFTYMLQLRGAFNTAFSSLGLDFLVQDWLGNPSIAIWSVAAVIIWKQFGFGVVLFLARLMSIDQSLYEAADVDGASWWQKFFKITIPQSAAVIEFFITLSLIDMLSWVFGFIYTMTAGGPGMRTVVLEYLMYKKAFGGGDYNIALAIGTCILIIAIIIIVLQGIVTKRIGSSDE